MKGRTLLMAGCLIAVGAIAAVVALRNDSVPPVPVSIVEAPPATKPSVALIQPKSDPPPSAIAEASPPAPIDSAKPAQAEQPAQQKGSPPTAKAKTKTRNNAPAPAVAFEDKPIARQALSFVGADPNAEAVWYSAINDPNTSAHDRQDLIEDLNEDGFEDPKNASIDELPLIENRLALIEQLAPTSMDDVNSAAFAEAYKDLVNMRARLVGQ